MKRFAWIIGLIFCTICTIQAKDRVIERPPFLAWSSNSIEIDKIVMSDTVTTVYIKAFYRPKYWIKIATGSFLKDNNGMLYPIRKGVGITLDKEFWMPESGEAEFQLLFPPIPENVTSLDFSEGDFDGAYKIWGIQLDKDTFYKQKLPKEAVVHKINKKAILPTPKLVYGTATLKWENAGLSERDDATNEDAYRKPCIECPQRTEYHKDQRRRHFSGGGQNNVRYKCIIRTSFWLDRVSDSSQRRDIAHHQYKGTMP